MQMKMKTKAVWMQRQEVGERGSSQIARATTPPSGAPCLEHSVQVYNILHNLEI
jgi:hypothetical protein